eukprot:147875-Pleurochrysis_carterae.AAC.1
MSHPRRLARRPLEKSARRCCLHILSKATCLVNTDFAIRKHEFRGEGSNRQAVVEGVQNCAHRAKQQHAINTRGRRSIHEQRLSGIIHSQSYLSKLGAALTA